VQKNRKSVKIRQSYRQFKGENFLRHSVDAKAVATVTDTFEDAHSSQ